MRNITPLALQTLSQLQAIEPVNVVAINWNGAWKYYADKEYRTYKIEGRILELSTIQSVMNISQNANTSSINLRLSDHDGELKKIFNNVDIHKRSVLVYQWFEGIPFNDAFVIFEGKIGSPIEWKEGERSLSFEVFTQIEDSEIGFSAEEGDFEYIPSNVIGEAWPLVFGTVAEVPAIRLLDPPVGAISKPIGSLDQNGVLNEKNNQDESYATCIENWRLLLLAAGALLRDSQLNFFLARADAHPDDLRNLAQRQYTEGKRLEALANQYLQKAGEIQRNSFDRSVDKDDPALTRNQLKIIGGKLYPQGVETSITIGGVTMTGIFNSDVFTIFNRGNPFTNDDPIAGPTVVTEDGVSVNYATELALQRFFYAVGGTATRIFGIYPITYIASLMHTTILSVIAFKNVNGVRFKATVPPNLYVIQHLNFVSIDATFITFPTPLSCLTDQGWEDDIFCNIQSPIGPNLVNILIWAIQNYSNKSIDASSFAIVAARTAAYPLNFALTNRIQLARFLQDLTYQSRCSVYLKQEKYYLKYLPAEEDPVDTIVDDDIEFGTITISCDDTENLVTKYTGTWKQYNNQQKPNLVILRYNVAKYGLHELTDNYYIYNDVNLVSKSMSFWLVRKGNTWKKLSFSCHVSKLRLETFDTVLLDFTRENFVAIGSVKAIIDSCEFDSSSQRVQISCWVPIRFGEMTKFPFYWPALIGTEFIFPQVGDPYAGGGGPGQQAKGKLFNQPPNFGQQTFSTSPNSDQYRRSMTDLNDVAPSVDFILDNREIEQGNQPKNNGKSFKQYQIKPFTQNDIGLDFFNGVFPAEVVEPRGGNEYDVDVFFNGLANQPTTVKAIQLKIREGSTIPAGTPCHVVRNYTKITDFEGRVRNIPEYTIQVGIWLNVEEGDESNASKGTDQAQQNQDDIENSDAPGFEEEGDIDE